MNEGGVVSWPKVSTEDVDLVAFRTAGRLPFWSRRLSILLSPDNRLPFSKTLSFLPAISSLLERSFPPVEVGGVRAECGVVGLEDSADCVAYDAKSSIVAVLFVNIIEPSTQSMSALLLFLTSFLLWSRVHLRIPTIDHYHLAILFFDKRTPFEILLVSTTLYASPSTLLASWLLFATF